MNDLFDLRDRVAIVTGASSGLGNRFARVLHDAGAHVVVVARRTAPLEALARELARVTVVTADVADPADAERIVESALATHGRIDILVNNAGTSIDGRAVDESLDSFRRVVDVNLVGLFHLSRLCARHMIDAGRGAIVNIASMQGLVASAPLNNASYCASKGAVVNLTRELAVQWARKGVRVNALAPGWFASEMNEAAFGDEDAMGYFVRNCPMARTGEPHELDGALLFLASDASSYVTGETIVVDGGWVAR